MRLVKIAVFVLVATLAGAGATLADEVVHFTNGTYMTIRSHSVKDDMVEVVLGSDARMAFPIAMVDHISVGGTEVFVGPAGAARNQAVAGAAGSSGASGGSPRGTVNMQASPMHGRHTGPQRSGMSRSESRRGMQGGDPVQNLGWGADGGSNDTPDVGRPFPTAGNRNMRRVSTVGNQALMRPGQDGMQRSGQQRLLSDPNATPGKDIPLVRVEARVKPQATKHPSEGKSGSAGAPPTSPEGSGSSGSGGGDPSGN